MSGTNGKASTSASIELIDQNTGVITSPESMVAFIGEKYSGASTLQITDEEMKILQEPVNQLDVDIRPDGLIYLPQVFVRDRLNKAFKPGGWALIEEWAKQNKNTMMFKGSLYIKGHFVASAIGEMEYHENNSKMSWASVYEGSKSDCLSRAAKDLGIGKECWMPVFRRDWIAKYAIKVWRTKVKDGRGEFQWRHIDSLPFYDEGNVAPDSPNQPKGKPVQPTNVNTNSAPAKSKNNPQSQTGTAFKPMSDAQLKKELAGTNSLNNMRILFDRITKTNPNQAAKFKAEFTKRRKAIENKLMSKTPDQPAEKPATPANDVVNAVIDALTAPMFDRGDWKSLEKLIEDCRDVAKKNSYIFRYKRQLEAIGRGDHEVDIVPF